MQNKNILFAGGGTLGSVMPLLALQEDLSRFNCFWVGTRDGVEKKFVENQGIPFFSITTSKFPRYLSIEIFTALPKLLKSIRESKKLLQKIKPDVVVTAGSFVGVPVCRAAYQMKIPYCIMQLDLHSNLSNNVLSSNAASVMIALNDMSEMFPKKKAVVTGIPVSAKFLSSAKHAPTTKRKTILFLGGGTGSLWINTYISEQLKSLTEIADVIHIQGKQERAVGLFQKQEGYESFSEGSRNDMARMYARSDIVVSRAGMGTISELAALHKPAILIPMPNSHQEDNAIFFENKQAVIVHHQRDGQEHLTNKIRELVFSKTLQITLSENIAKIFPSHASQNAAQTIISHIAYE